MLERIRVLTLEQAAAARGFVLRHIASWRPRPEPSPEPKPLEREDHWARVTGTVAAAIAGCERALTLHAAAAHNLDAADYTFHRVLGELATVMPLAADGAPLRVILAEAARQDRRTAAKAALAA